ncbi:hypothetical protein AU476_07325 [Cupriavidus sp. UYMSc13B]|nr:hypothetical protein AU476_07325 [Cupriavidus sp. UYMSc13B]
MAVPLASNREGGGQGALEFCHGRQDHQATAPTTSIVVMQLRKRVLVRMGFLLGRRQVAPLELC